MKVWSSYTVCLVVTIFTTLGTRLRQTNNAEFNEHYTTHTLCSGKQINIYDIDMHLVPVARLEAFRALKSIGHIGGV